MMRLPDPQIFVFVYLCQFLLLTQAYGWLVNAGPRLVRAGPGWVSWEPLEESPLF